MGAKKLRKKLQKQEEIFYVDGFQTATTFHGMTVRMTRTQPGSKDHGVKRVVTVGMSLETAKSLSQSLVKQIVLYEQHCGEIRTAEGMVGEVLKSSSVN